MRDSPNENSYPSLIKSGSSSTLTEKTWLSELDSSVAPRNILRRRGTDGGSVSSTQSGAEFLWKASAPPRTSLPSPPIEQPLSPSPFTNPRVLVRQPSMSWLAPPSAPPSGGLPAPPLADSPISNNGIGLRNKSSCSSSSSLSFPTAASSARVPPQEIGSRRKEREGSPDLRFPGGHKVKRSISHQNFTKRPSYNFSTGSGASTPIEQGEVKVPRKQRSFHHNSRMILPSLSAPLRQPFPVPSQPKSPPPSSPETHAEHRGGGVTSTSVRKRLFSGSSMKRPSSQTFSAGEDDYQSVFTAEGEPQQGMEGMEPVGSIKLPPPSFWDNGPSDLPPTSPVVSTSEYIPQMIVSPAEMRRVEAPFNEGLDDDDVGNLSGQHLFTSTSTSALDRNGLEGLSPPLSPTHYIIDRASSTSSGTPRSPSTPGSGPSSPLRNSLRPPISPNNVVGNCSPFPSIPLSPSMGLPPPPRSRRPTVIKEPEITSTSLPPHPIRRVNTTSTRRPLVRSILKKPSFLDIEDEVPVNPPFSATSAFASSFLDLDRGKESFDTIRSEDEQGGGE